MWHVASTYYRHCFYLDWMLQINKNGSFFRHYIRKNSVRDQILVIVFIWICWALRRLMITSKYIVFWMHLEAAFSRDTQSDYFLD